MSTERPAYVDRSNAVSTHPPGLAGEGVPRAGGTGRAAGRARRQVVAQERVERQQLAVAAGGGRRRRGSPVEIAQRRPLVGAGGCGLHDHVVERLQGAVRQLHPQGGRGAARYTGQVERPGDPLVGHRCLPGARVAGPFHRTERIDGGRAAVRAGRLSGEQREVLRRQHVAGEGEGPGGVERVGGHGRPAKAGRHAVERAATVDARRTHELSPVGRAEVVLGEVVRQQQAVRQEVAGDDAVLIRRTVEPVEDPAERAAEQPVVLRVLPGLDELAALVEEVAQRDRQELLPLGDRDIGHRSEQERVGERVLRVLHQPVVTGLPHDDVEVARARRADAGLPARRRPTWRG